MRYEIRKKTNLASNSLIFKLYEVTEDFKFMRYLGTCSTIEKAKALIEYKSKTWKEYKDPNSQEYYYVSYNDV